MERLDIPEPLSAFEAIFMSIGMCGNILCGSLLFRNRLMPDRNINLNAVLGFTQSSLDCTMLLFYILAYINFPRVHNENIGGLICSLIRSNCIFWMLATLRAGVNLVIAILNFIKLIYPFLSTSVNIISLMGVGLTLLIIISLLQTVPHFSSVQFNYNDTGPNCDFNPDLSQTEFLGMYRFFALFNLIYLYVFPVTAGMYMYSEVFKCLKESDDAPRKIAYMEMKKNFMLDQVLYAICFAFHNIMFFLTQYTEQIDYAVSTKVYRWGILLSAFYCVLYPLISLPTRRAYKKPLIDFLDSGPFRRKYRRIRDLSIISKFETLAEVQMPKKNRFNALETMVDFDDNEKNEWE